MKVGFLVRIIVFVSIFSGVFPVLGGNNTREERRLIMDGNKLYVGRKYKDAAAKYSEALKINSESAVAKYNLGLSEIRQVVNVKDTSARNTSLLENATKRLTEVASMAREKPGLAAKANYNLGNLSFNREDFSGAINYYKEALRIDPKDNNARKNLRIAQLKQQQQQQDKNNDKNQDQNQDQQDKKDQNENKDKEKQNPDDKKDNNDQDKQNEDKGDINKQTASQILQAIDNKESQTRARVNRANKGDKSVSGGRRIRKW